MTRIRLVALDIDGTLLNSRDQLSPVVQEAVREAAAQGVQVVLATGRWLGSARRWAGRLDAGGHVISHNGARVTRLDDEKDLLHLTMPLGASREIVAFMDEHGFAVNLTIGDLTYMRPRAGLDPLRLPADVRVEALHSPFLRAAPTTALVFDPKGIDAIPARFAVDHSGVIAFNVNRTSGTSDHLTMCHPDVDKGKALLMVCRELGIDPQETMAVGDAASDAAMFRVAGVGVAMGNALASVQADAHAVAPTNDEDGVAWALQRFVLREG